MNQELWYGSSYQIMSNIDLFGFVSMYSLRIFIADCCLAILRQLGRDRNEQKWVTEYTGDKFLEFYSYG